MKNSKKSKNSGVTLIALVVTIIVLMILAGIAVAALMGDNGIIKRAGEAKEQTAIGREKEIVALAYSSALAKNLSNGGTTSITSEDMNTELTNQGANARGNNPIKITFTDSRRQYTINTNGEITYAGIKSEDDTIKVGDLEIGDYIKYGDKLTIKTYETDESYSWVSQTFETNNQMLWRVMNKKENGDVEIVAVSNMVDNGDANITIENYQNGELIENHGLIVDFLYAETVLNEMCNQLYSSDYGTGRSINVDDINKLNNFNPQTSLWTDLDSEVIGDETYGTLREYNSGPVWDEENNVINTASNNNPLSIRNTHYSYYLSSNMPLYDTLAGGIQNGDTSTYYWLASRCWNANTSGNQRAYNYNMQIRFIGMGRNQTEGPSVRDWQTYSLNLGGAELDGPEMCGVRPVVTLNGEISIQDDSTKNGKTEATAYELE